MNSSEKASVRSMRICTCCELAWLLCGRDLVLDVWDARNAAVAGQVSR